MKAKKLQGWSMVCLLAAAACGSSESGPSCAQICKRIEAPQCPNAAPNCVDACHEDTAKTPKSCERELNELTSCFGGATFTCDVQGVPTADGCKRQLDAWTSCLGSDADAGAGAGDGDSTDTGDGDAGDGSTGNLCAAATGDTACDSCIKGSCCNEVQACDAECQAVVDCVNTCANDDVCMNSCAQQHASGVQPANDVLTCAANSCAATCGDSSDGGAQG